MIGIEFNADRTLDVARIIAEARERGVLLMPAGAGNVIRALVPLVIDDADLDEALQRIGECCHKVLATAEVKENS